LAEGDAAQQKAAGRLAHMLDKGRNLTVAEAIYNELLFVQKRALGPEHSDTLTTATMLAGVLVQQLKFEPAMAIYEYVVPIRQRLLGSEHPVNLNLLSNLASCFAQCVASAKIRWPHISECLGRITWTPSEL
jgi:hypothetical protein